MSVSGVGEPGIDEIAPRGGLVVAAISVASGRSGGAAGWSWFVSDTCWEAGISDSRTSTLDRELEAYAHLLDEVPYELTVVLLHEGDTLPNAIFIELLQSKARGWADENENPIPEGHPLRRIDAHLSARMANVDLREGTVAPEHAKVLVGAQRRAAAVAVLMSGTAIPEPVALTDPSVAMTLTPVLVPAPASDMRDVLREHEPVAANDDRRVGKSTARPPVPKRRGVGEQIVLPPMPPTPAAPAPTVIVQPLTEFGPRWNPTGVPEYTLPSDAATAETVDLRQMNGWDHA